MNWASLRHPIHDLVKEQSVKIPNFLDFDFRIPDFRSKSNHDLLPDYLLPRNLCDSGSTT